MQLFHKIDAGVPSVYKNMNTLLKKRGVSLLLSLFYGISTTVAYLVPKWPW